MMPYGRLPNGIMQNLKKVVKAGGNYGTNGLYVQGTQTYPTFKGAIFPLTMDDLKFDQGGTYTKDSQKLLTYETLINGQEIMDINNLTYKILESTGYNPYAGGLNIYYIDRVGATAE